MLTLLWPLSLACAPASPKDSPQDSAPLPWPPDPSTYDCSAASPPARRSAVPVACMTDRNCAERLVSGHRGMGGTLGVIAPEDTVIAVRAAIAYGVDYVETDPRPTADGALVNLHDDSVDRTTDGVGLAADLTLAEIQALTVDTGDLPGDLSCAQIPTLTEILQAAVGGVHVLVDANKTDRVDLLVASIQEADALQWAIFDTSSPEKIEAALALEPDLLTMIRVASEDDLAAQLDRFASHPPVIVEIDDATPELASAVLAAGHRPLRDVFLTDIAAYATDDASAYAEVYQDGLIIAQSDRPELVLEYLGR